MSSLVVSVSIPLNESCDGTIRSLAQSPVLKCFLIFAPPSFEADKKLAHSGAFGCRSVPDEPVVVGQNAGARQELIVRQKHIDQLIKNVEDSATGDAYHAFPRVCPFNKFIEVPLFRLDGASVVLEVQQLRR